MSQGKCNVRKKCPQNKFSIFKGGVTTSHAPIRCGIIFVYSLFFLENKKFLVLLEELILQRLQGLLTTNA